ncbi:polymer-forming cytoskeletal protein [Pseudoalteromonas fenneropenaei]|uniref:Polymer-forming cytoskeletal protein n=1 Tax=Pseudoalteromonas fenneropenaei TaxID=1737459 RepID=A0ABV7CLW2_9GAMM
MRRERGFTLMTVMVLTAMASVVVFAALKESIVQERLSGNFQKDLNARLLAEKGVYDHINELNRQLSGDPTLTLQRLVDEHGKHTGQGLVGSDAQFDSTLAISASGELEITSIGARHQKDAVASIVARFRFEPGVNESVFGNAVTGCKGVNLSGSGEVDSYDSSKGTYEETKTNDGDVNTVVGDADVVLSGHSPIKGDVQASGVIYLKGSSPVIGNVQSNTGVDISYGNGVRVEGNVLTQGFFMHRGGSITGYVRANGDATMKWGSQILNQDNDEFAIQYGGKGSFDDTATHSQNGVPYSNSRFKVNPNVAAVKVYDPNSPDYDPANPDKECDPLALPFNMPEVMQNSHRFTPFSVGPTQVYQFTPTQGDFVKNGRGGIRTASSQSIYLFNALTQNKGENKESSQLVFGLKGVNLTSDGVVNIKDGDVIWLVDGNFTMSGDTRINIAKNSSLTVFVTGKVNLGASARVVAEKEGITASGFPSLSFFSSYKGNDGFIFSGDSDLYAAIYAPTSLITLKGSGELFGTVRGASINASGGSGVHFDSALKNLKIGNGSGVKKPAKVTFLGWSYKPNSEPVAKDETSEDAK